MNYSEKLFKALQFSRQEAERLGNESIMPEHLLLGIIRLGEGKACQMLTEAGTDLSYIKETLEKDMHLTENHPNNPIAYSRSTERVLRILELETQLRQASESDTSHLLLAILKEKMNRAASVLNDMFHISYESLEQRYPQLQQQPRMGAGFTEDEDEEEVRSTKTTSRTKQSDTPALDAYGIDLTREAEEGRLDPVIGRGREIERLMQILARRKKNNPILIGEPGVGKSAIVEGLAQRLAQYKGKHAKRLISLEVGNIVAGTKYRGQFEERMKNVIAELQQHPEIILFIDEIHTIIGAGNQAGQLDAANMLKPALARGVVQCIGATTLNEYQKSIEKDGALERRFQKVMVSPTTKEETLTILQQIAPHYASHHGVTYSDEALKACVDLTDRYITDRTFPDKAIDALDEVGAYLKAQSEKESQKSDNILNLEKQLHKINEQKENVLLQQNYEQAVALRDQARDLEVKLQDEVVKWQQANEEQRKNRYVTDEDVAKVVEQMAAIPVQKIAKEENEQLRNLVPILQKRVIGQDSAVKTIVKSIQRSRVGLRNPNRPIGNFLLLGPTGVGKTFLAQCLAEELFGTKDALIRIDMSEYMEKHAVSLLVGAPPGYVGHEDAGKLTEAVRRKPYSIVLFDEIEKAHSDIFNILLQVMDEGRLTDRQGRQVDFRNTIIIMTSNVGTRQLKEFGAGIGFAASQMLSEKDTEAMLKKALHKTFAPEFINRIDNIVTFNSLTNEHMKLILDNAIDYLHERLHALGYNLTLSDEAKALIIKEGYDAQFGARPLRRAIVNLLEDELTDFLLNHTQHEMSENILATVENDKIIIKTL